MNSKLSTGRLPERLALILAVVGVFPTILLGQGNGLDVVRGKLEGELTTLLELNPNGTEDLSTLLRVSALYLDLGYGVYSDSTRKLVTFREGARWAKRALEVRESSAEAHFLYAANLGSGAELEGLVASALTLPEIKEHVKRVLELDQTYAPAHHMLGRLYEDLPWILGGDQKAAGKHLKMAVDLDALYPPARLDLAKWLIKQGQKEKARQELTIVIDQAPMDKKWLWETRYKPEARALLQQISESDKSTP